jgi:hypothetical protein
VKKVAVDERNWGRLWYNVWQMRGERISMKFSVACFLLFAFVSVLSAREVACAAGAFSGGVYKF